MKNTLQSKLYHNKAAVGDVTLGKAFMQWYPKKF